MTRLHHAPASHAPPDLYHDLDIADPKSRLGNFNSVSLLDVHNSSSNNNNNNNNNNSGDDINGGVYYPQSPPQKGGSTTGRLGHFNSVSLININTSSGGNIVSGGQTGIVGGLRSGVRQNSIRYTTKDLNNRSTKVRTAGVSSTSSRARTNGVGLHSSRTGNLGNFNSVSLINIHRTDSGKVNSSILGGHRPFLPNSRSANVASILAASSQLSHTITPLHAASAGDLRAITSQQRHGSSASGVRDLRLGGSHAPHVPRGLHGHDHVHTDGTAQHSDNFVLLKPSPTAIGSSTTDATHLSELSGTQLYSSTSSLSSSSAPTISTHSPNTPTIYSKHAAHKLSTVSLNSPYSSSTLTSPHTTTNNNNNNNMSIRSEMTSYQGHRQGHPVSRSHSFGSVSLTSNSSTAPPAVLGEGVRRAGPHYAKPAVRGVKRGVKVVKVPRPARAMMVFDSVKTGIGEFIQATHEDIAQLMANESGTSTAQGRVHETDKQIKAAERYLKRLEFHLAKIDELHDCYTLNQQLREGARTMARAFSASPQSRKDSLTNVKYGYKECSQTMCAIEAQLENMLGTFSCRLKGIAGFARLAPGDVFEVIIKHGAQKWRSKGRVEKTNGQKWDHPEFTFKCLVGETLNIKASEVRAFKSQVLGQKSCEVCHPSSHEGSQQGQGLFSANPQLMTVSINVHGSLKLSIIITWNPLDGMDETVSYFEPPLRTPGPTRHRPMSGVGLNGADHSPLQSPGLRDDSGIYGSANSLAVTSDLTRYPSSLSGSPRGPRGPSLTPDFRSRPHSVIAVDCRSVASQPPSCSPHTRPHSVYASSPYTAAVSETASSTSSSPFASNAQLAAGSHDVPEVPQSMVPGVQVQVSSPGDAKVTVEEALGSLQAAMEDFLGHYPELQALEEVVPCLEVVLHPASSNTSRASSLSVSIEGAIEEAFDFLNTEDDIEEMDEEEEESSPQHTASATTSLDTTVMSPASTAKTGDSGISSLAARLSEDTRLSSSGGSSPVPPSSGNEQVDTALVVHLTYCDKLLENLGNFGPLKCREFHALDRLQRQAGILSTLLGLAGSGPDVDLHYVFSQLSADKAVRELWVLSVDQTALYVTAEKLVNVLVGRFGGKLKDTFNIKPMRVFHYLLSEILDIPCYSSELSKSVVTLHQYLTYFQQAGGLIRLDMMAEELKLIDRFNAGSSDTVMKAILSLRESLPASACLKVLARLLLSAVPEIRSSAASYLKVIQRQPASRDAAMVVLVEGLEDRLPEVRAGCCLALATLEAEETLAQLVHVCQTDGSMTVRRKAKEAVFSLGEAGRKALEEAQLGSQGFQGLKVRQA